MQINNKNVFFYADPHFGHKNVIRYCHRPFTSVSEMNTQLIKNFNNVVTNDDVVYILGDISFLNTTSTTEIVKSLKGYKILVKGNHDNKSNTAYRKMGFMEVYDRPVIFNTQYILSHEPIIDELYKDSGFINIYGHVHNNAVNNSNSKFCVSVELIDYKPISFEDIKKELRKPKGLGSPYWVPRCDLFSYTGEMDENSNNR